MSEASWRAQFKDIGPASYAVTTSDLHAIDPLNKLKAYAEWHLAIDNDI